MSPKPSLSDNAETASRPQVRPLVAGLGFSKIREISRIGMGRDDVIPLWFGEPDQPTPEFITAAAKRAMDDGHTFYTHNRGIPELREAIAAYLSALYGREVGLERITVTASAMNGLMVVMQTLLGPGDNMIAVVPLWPNILEAAHIQGAETREVPLSLAERGWVLDLERLMAACDARTRLVFVNSPNNPTGWMMAAEQQQELLAFCRRRGLWLVADEVYDRIVYDGAHAPSLVELAEPEDAVLAVNSFSKSWCMTGWRIGWITAPERMGRTLEMMNEYNIACASTIAQHAGITALKEGEAFIARTVAHYRQGRDLVFQRLGAMPRLTWPLPPAAFYAFFAVDGLDDSLALATELVLEHGLGLAPGSAFGPSGEGFLRLCFASTPETLSRAMDRLEGALA